MPENNICFYHGSDNDGLCCGAIYARAERNRPHKLYPIEHGWGFPWVEVVGANVTMMDFSLPWPEMVKLFETAASVTWIDHHSSAIKSYIEWSERGGAEEKQLCPTICILDKHTAACKLAWQYYFPSKKVPLSVELIHLHDTWDHSNSMVWPFHYGLFLHDLDPRDGRDKALWKQIFDSPSFIEDVMNDGEVVAEYVEKADASLASWTTFAIDWEGWRWLACNSAGRGSQFFKSVYDRAFHDAVMRFSWNGRQWGCGLYRMEDGGPDCGEIAKKYGGGGHAGAAGFRCDELPFELK